MRCIVEKDYSLYSKISNYLNTDVAQTFSLRKRHKLKVCATGYAVGAVSSRTDRNVKVILKSTISFYCIVNFEIIGILQMRTQTKSLMLNTPGRFGFLT